MKIIDISKSRGSAGTARSAWVLFTGLALSGAAVHAAALTEADIIAQLDARPAVVTGEVDPDEVFANADPSRKSLSRVRLPDTNGACLEEATQSAGQKALVVIPLAPAGAPQVNLTLQFELGKYVLTKSDQLQLNTLVRALNNEKLRNASFAVAGHTDDIGQALINKKLSCARALAVRSYLINAGIEENRVTAYGFGSTRPLLANAPNAPENRRVEFRRAEN